MRMAMVVQWKRRVLVIGMSGWGLYVVAGRTFECTLDVPGLSSALVKALGESQIPGDLSPDIRSRKLSPLAEYLGVKRESDLWRVATRVAVVEKEDCVELRETVSRGKTSVAEVARSLPSGSPVEEVAAAVIEILS